MSNRAAAVVERDRGIHLAEEDLRSIRREAEQAYPGECCGILVGTLRGGIGRVRKALRATNAQRGRRDRFEIPPEEILRAIEASRAAGEEIVGYYHSHPDREARPSSVDRRDAWPGLSYVIASVVQGEAGEVRSWRLAGDGDFVEESIHRDQRSRA